ncbi:tRNA (adenosine(37)-N6)-dimethylallyltransferase MiaA [Alteromonas facilis]|uniref:tRNA (adenosine(37)-N6)-dimethylallyltransferase MiaA n=1 Tax=Alteromonas facilis TaxID=2048004 RepID=UPI000C284CEA|nr:tRNA (adenosine(37)-N6)-dimethylallyltransferase MiaA [Alteromonas facilis]
MAKPSIITFMGPTASGKTGLSLTLARDLNCEIVSVDSALIYREMDIGTAKPTREEQQQAPHWLLDIIDPAESYSVADFCRDARQHIADIHQRGKTPLLVGGTMMYFNALMNGISQVPEAKPEIRDAIQAEALERGWPAMHAELEAVDPVVASRVHPNDPQRIGRALEVYHATGKPLSHWQLQKTPGLADDPSVSVFQFAIAPNDRKVLHQRIQQRFEQMLAEGFIEEVEQLRARGDLHLDMPSMRCVGYRQVWQYLQGDFDADEMLEKGVAATRQLAKRQFTWLRGWDKLHWLDTFAHDNSDQIRKMVIN